MQTAVTVTLGIYIMKIDSILIEVAFNIHIFI